MSTTSAMADLSKLVKDLERTVAAIATQIVLLGARLDSLENDTGLCLKKASMAAAECSEGKSQKDPP
jgi:hypothetical protein